MTEGTHPLVRHIKSEREHLARLLALRRPTAADRYRITYQQTYLAGMERAATLSLDMADLADLHRHARGES